MSAPVEHAPLPPGSDLLTESRLKTARACPRKHQLRYVEGWVSTEEAQALRFGTLIHKGLEAWWKAPLSTSPDAGAPEDRPSAALAAMQGESDPFDLVKAEELIRGYDIRWGDEPLEVIAVEQEFVAPLMNPEGRRASRTWRLAGKVDVIVRDADGKEMLVEHKTSSEDIGPGSAYWKRLVMDGQISMYYEGARSLGHDIAGCLYDVIGKPTIRPREIPVTDEDGVKIVRDSSGARVRTKDGKKWRESGDTAQGYVLQTRPETPEEFRLRLRDDIAENPDRYYQRGTVVRLESEKTEAMADTWAIGKAIAENMRLGRAPRNPDACMNFGRQCTYFPICSGEASLDSGAFHRLPIIHPELSEVVFAQRPNEEAQPCISSQQ